MGKTLIIGCGYVGARIARLAQANGDEVFGTVRNEERAAQLEQEGVRVMRGNLDDPESLPSLPTGGAMVYYLAPPPGGGLLDPRVRTFCAAVGKGKEPAKLIYMSTSGVYGDCGGALVDETASPAPLTPRGKRRLDAERYLLEWGRERNVPVVILRVSAIYGPGRLPIPHIESGNPVLRENESPLSNRVHAEDLATICLAAAEKGEAGEIFNVSDGECTTMTHYFNAVADFFGLIRPPQVTRKEAGGVMNPLLLSYFSESRCLDNRKMLERLGVVLRYPTLEQGLRGSRMEGN